MNKTIERQIVKIYNEVYKKVFTQQNLHQLANNNRTTAQSQLLTIASSQAYDEFAKLFALELAKKGLRGQTGVWRKYYEAARAAHYIALPATYNEFELHNLSMAVQHNYKMIKSIPTYMMEIFNHKYTSALIEEVAKGTTSRGSFAKLLAKHGHKQAKLIARTETAKLQTEITRTRATNLGSVAYIWRSSKDRRTRPSHKEMDGVIVFWRPDSQKPLRDNMRGDAGEFPNCRCDAEPIVDIDDIVNSRYKVYDYRTDKITSMSKGAVVEALENGELSTKTF